MPTAGDYTERVFVAEFYDYVVPYREREDIAFFVEMAQQMGGPVLELGCGTGRVLLPIARAGVGIVGVDLSAPMLSVCRRKLAAEPAAVRARVELVESDMRRFSLGREFPLITIPFRSFQHLLTLEDELACLAAIHRHLRAGGRLLLDLFNPDLPRLCDDRYLTEEEEEPAFSMPDGRQVRRRSRVLTRDLARQVQEVELTYYVSHPDGREERLVSRFALRYLFRFEAEHLLARAGFRVQAIYADYDRSPYGSKYPGELILVARKEQTRENGPVAVRPGSRPP